MTISGLLKFGRDTREQESVSEPPQPQVRISRPDSPWHRAGEKYDVCRGSKTDLRQLAEQLYQAGAISLPDLRILSLHPDTYSRHWPNWSTFETPGEHDGRRDWICEIEARIAKGHEDQAYIAYQNHLLFLLKRVDAARKEVEAADRALAPVPETASPSREGPRLQTLLAPAFAQAMGSGGASSPSGS